MRNVSDKFVEKNPSYNGKCFRQICRKKIPLRMRNVSNKFVEKTPLIMRNVSDKFVEKKKSLLE